MSENVGIQTKQRRPITDLLGKAMAWQRRLESGEVLSLAEIALSENITRARVTQIMGLLRLAPEIRKDIFFMSKSIQPQVTERALRPIAAIADHRRQVIEFKELLRL